MDLKTRVEMLLSKYGQNDQRTNAWHLKRGEMLTASEIWKTVKDATPAQRHEIIMSKLTPREDTNGPGARALIWGTQFEPIAKRIYENTHNVKIVDTSCVQHPDHTFLGASPDGVLLTDDVENVYYGNLIEIKCPISRDFDDTTNVPSHYMHQMQLQMECTKLDICQYAEFKFRTMQYGEWVTLDSSTTKGIFLVCEDGTVHYKPSNDSRDIGEWKDSIIPADTSDPFTTQIIFWALTKHKFQTVHKDPEWLATHLPSFQSSWSVIQKHKLEGTLPAHPQELTRLVL